MVHCEGVQNWRESEMGPEEEKESEEGGKSCGGEQVEKVIDGNGVPGRVAGRDRRDKQAS